MIAVPSPVLYPEPKPGLDQAVSLQVPCHQEPRSIFPVPGACVGHFWGITAVSAGAPAPWRGFRTD